MFKFVFVLTSFFVLVAQAESSTAPSFYHKAFNIARGSSSILQPLFLAKQLVQIILDGLKNTEEIQNVIQKRKKNEEQLLRHQKSHKEHWDGQRKRIKELRESIQEAKNVVKSHHDQSLEDMQAELYELLTQLPRSNLIIDHKVGARFDTEPSISEMPTVKSSWKVPGIWSAPSTATSSANEQKPVSEVRVSGESESCQTCNKTFSFLRWQHKCESCGEIVCSSCLRTKHGQQGAGDLSESLLGSCVRETIEPLAGLSEQEAYRAKIHFQEVLHDARQRQYWPRRYRDVFSRIIQVTNQSVSELNWQYLNSPITKDTAHISAESKKSILDTVLNAWRLYPERCRQVCLQPTGPLIKEELTLETLKAFKPCDFRDYNREGRMMVSDVRRLLDKLLEGITPHSFNYDSETLIISVPENISNRMRLIENFKPYESVFTLNFFRYVEQ